MTTEPIEVETQAVAVRENGAVDRALSASEIGQRLAFIKQVMRENMTEGVDYGKVPGCGDKPGLFQPGAQKLSMTFQLAPTVHKEVLRELRTDHREYEFTLAITALNGRTLAHGVGSCSTLEGKYRYRSGERKCPACGKPTIIKGKEQYGGGWICFTKKNGCGAKFEDNDPAITSQQVGKVEHDNPADFYNTVRKMAFKRALVHGMINATNTSELWSQDLEDIHGNNQSEHEPPPKTKPTTRQSEPPPASHGNYEEEMPSDFAGLPTTKPGTAPKAPGVPPNVPPPTDESRTKMLAELKAGIGGENRKLVDNYFNAIAAKLETEPLEVLQLTHVPATAGQMRELGMKLAAFERGDNAEPAFPPHPLSWFTKAATKPEPAKVYTPTDESAKAHLVNGEAGEWFWNIIIPIPPKGVPKVEYLKHPQTIKSLYELRHGSDDESQAARQRLFGFVNFFEPKGWEKRDGTKMPASEADHKFRRALDAFKLWHEATHPNEKL